MSRGLCKRDGDLKRTNINVYFFQSADCFIRRKSDTSQSEVLIDTPLGEMDSFFSKDKKRVTVQIFSFFWNFKTQTIKGISRKYWIVVIGRSYMRMALPWNMGSTSLKWYWSNADVDRALFSFRISIQFLTSKNAFGMQNFFVRIAHLFDLCLQSPHLLCQKTDIILFFSNYG